MKRVIQIILTVAIVVLGYLIIESIMKPIRFNRQKDMRWNATIERLKDIRTAELAYKSEYGKFTGSFDTLINFVEADSFSVVKAIGTVPDSLTEAQALAQNLVVRDTIPVSVKDSLFGKSFPVDSLQYVPYATDHKFTLGAGEIETGSKVTVQVFEAKVPNSILLHGMDEQLVANFNDERIKLTGYAGLKVGSLTEA
ncbi:MAG TPA: hypothetical protein VE912_21570, partial [Bacteroidales bacterium]|nr:hypothetical protein [Bacteroidales bacterium]